MAAYRQLLAENHVEDILQDVKQNKNLDRKKELPVWLPLAASFKNGTRKAEDAVPSGLFFLDIDEKGLTEALWNKVREENLIQEFRIVYFAEECRWGNPHLGLAHTRTLYRGGHPKAGESAGCQLRLACHRSGPLLFHGQ